MHTIFSFYFICYYYKVIYLKSNRFFNFLFNFLALMNVEVFKLKEGATSFLKFGEYLLVPGFQYSTIDGGYVKNRLIMSGTYIAQGHKNEKGRYAGKELLEEIKETCGIRGDVRPQKKEGKLTSDYRLYFNKDDLEFFKKMFSVYEDSMERKCPYKRT